VGAKKKRGAAKLKIFRGVETWCKLLERQWICGLGAANAESLRHPAAQIADV
jgi:hypothetical protein